MMPMQMMHGRDPKALLAQMTLQSSEKKVPFPIYTRVFCSPGWLLLTLDIWQLMAHFGLGVQPHSAN